MFKFLIFCFLAGFAAGAEVEEPPSDSKLPAYLYNIYRNNRPVCLGTVVDVGSKKITIVTAAHCVYNAQPGGITVGQTNTATPVTQVIIHPYYMPPLIDYDIAVLKIKKPTKVKSSETLEFLELSKEEPKSQSDASFIIYWNIPPVENSPETLNNITALVEDRKSCRAKLANHLTISSKMLCANYQNATVPGGSPLMFKEKMAGVASSNLKGNLPRIFTNIANSEIFYFIDKYI